MKYKCWISYSPSSVETHVAHWIRPEVCHHLRTCWYGRIYQVVLHAKSSQFNIFNIWPEMYDWPHFKVDLKYWTCGFGEKRYNWMIPITITPFVFADILDSSVTLKQTGFSNYHFFAVKQRSPNAQWCGYKPSSGKEQKYCYCCCCGKKRWKEMVQVFTSGGTDSLNFFTNLNLLPCYYWQR